MSWFSPADELSLKAKETLTSLAESGQSESAGVAETLNTIAENGGDLATDAWLVGAAEQMIEAAQSVIDALNE